MSTPPPPPGYGPQGEPTGPQSPYDPPYSEQPYGQPYGEQPYGNPQQSPYGQPYGDQQPPHGGQYGGQPYGQPPGQDNSGDRGIAVLAHLSPLILLILSAGWLSFLGPLIMWFIWRGSRPLVRHAAANAFNFNLTVWALVVIGWICLFTVILIPLSLVLWIVAFVAQVVLSIKGAIRANRGEAYRYPLQIPILS